MDISCQTPLLFGLIETCVCKWLSGSLKCRVCVFMAGIEPHWIVRTADCTLQFYELRIVSFQFAVCSLQFWVALQAGVIESAARIRNSNQNHRKRMQLSGQVSISKIQSRGGLWVEGSYLFWPGFEVWLRDDSWADSRDDKWGVRVSVCPPNCLKTSYSPQF